MTVYPTLPGVMPPGYGDAYEHQARRAQEARRNAYARAAGERVAAILRAARDLDRGCDLIRCEDGAYRPVRPAHV